MPYKFKIRVINQVNYFPSFTCKKIVETNDLISFIQKPLTKMGPNETRTARNQYSFHNLILVAEFNINSGYRQQKKQITFVNDIHLKIIYYRLFSYLIKHQESYNFKSLNLFF